MSLENTFPTGIEDVRTLTLEQFRAISDGDATAIKKARATLRKMTQPSGVSHQNLHLALTKSFVESLVVLYEKTEAQKVKAQYLNALSELAYSIDDHVGPILLKLALREVCNPAHGTVRMAAVHLASRLRLTFDGVGSAMYPKTYRANLAKLRTMIEQRMPDVWHTYTSTNPVVVPMLEPSVLKSLLLLWREWSTREMFDPSFCKKNPELALPFPVVWEMEEDEEYEEVTKEELGDELWQGARPSKDVCVALQALETRAYKHLAFVMKQLEYDTKDVVRVVRDMTRVRDQSMLNPLIQRLAVAAAQHGWRPEQFGTVLRAIEGYVGNRLMHNVHGEPYSFLLAGAYNNLGPTYYKRIQEFPTCLLSAHGAVDEYISECVSECEEECAELEKFEHTITSNYFRQTIKQYEELRDIAHFTLDWYAEVEPNDVIKKEPRQLAALLLLAIDHLHWEAPMRGMLFLNRTTLREFGGWKSSPSGSARRVASVLRGTLPTLEPILVTSRIHFGDDDEEEGMAHEGSMPEESLSNRVVGSRPDQLDPKELELRLALLFERFAMSAEEFVPKVKAMIYELSAPDVDVMVAIKRYHDAFQALFPRTVQDDERMLMEIYATAVDAWNAYPHAALNGRSPLDMMRENT